CPAATRNELYVLGQVNIPGPLPFHPKTTLISAITQRGGFTPGAYRKKILIVRGSLKRPETYVVDSAEILSGKAPDFRLQPKDIIFVNKNPWQMVGQIIDLA